MTEKVRGVPAAPTEQGTLRLVNLTVGLRRVKSCVSESSGKDCQATLVITPMLHVHYCALSSSDSRISAPVDGRRGANPDDSVPEGALVLQRGGPGVEIELQLLHGSGALYTRIRKYCERNILTRHSLIDP